MHCWHLGLDNFHCGSWHCRIPGLYQLDESSIHAAIVFGQVGLLWRIPETGWLKQQTLISHSSEGWKAEIRMPVKSGSWGQVPGERPFPGYVLTRPSLVLAEREREIDRQTETQRQRQRDLLSSLFMRALIASCGAHPHNLI